MGLMDAVKKAAFVDILRGMSVTGTYFVVEKVTVEYPKEKVQTYPRFRGAQALLTDPVTGDTKCVACMLCATACPAECIEIIAGESPDPKIEKFPTTYNIAEVLEGYETLKRLAPSRAHIVPGHDPAVTASYPAAKPGLEGWVVKLDEAPKG